MWRIIVIQNDSDISINNENLTKEGQVRAIVVTNKQFEQMYHMVGEKTKQEININSEQITFL